VGERRRRYISFKTKKGEAFFEQRCPSCRRYASTENWLPVFNDVSEFVALENVYCKQCGEIDKKDGLNVFVGFF